MIPRPSARLVSRSLVALTVAAALGGLVRAQSREFYDQRQKLQQQAKADQQAAGLAGSANTKALFSKFPTPEIALAAPITIGPGQSQAVKLSGKFSDKTTFLSGTNGLTLANVAVAANSVSATLQAAPGFGPAWGRLYAFSPVSAAETWTPIFVGGAPPAYTLTAKNGWAIKLTPEAQKFALDQRSAKVSYKAEYFKPGEAKPFETASGSLTIDANDTGGQLTFSMAAGGQGSAMAEMEQIGKRMGELMKAGKYSGKEMQDLQARMEVVQERMTKEVEAMTKDPAAMQRKQDEFGCGYIYVTPKGDGTVTGNVSCGKNVGSLELTGTAGK